MADPLAHDMPDPPENTRCILLAPVGRGRSGDLVGLVEARGWDPVVLTDACLAMAELCLEDRTQSARTAWGLRPSRRLALVVVPESAPPAAARAEKLINAVRRYLPHVEVWLSDGRDLTPVPAASTSDDAPPGPSRSGAPAHAEAGGSPFAAPTAHRADRAQPELVPVEITREEIDMLFALGDEGREP